MWLSKEQKTALNFAMRDSLSQQIIGLLDLCHCIVVFIGGSEHLLDTFTCTSYISNKCAWLWVVNMSRRFRYTQLLLPGGKSRPCPAIYVLRNNVVCTGTRTHLLILALCTFGLQLNGNFVPVAIAEIRWQCRISRCYIIGAIFEKRKKTETRN